MNDSLLAPGDGALFLLTYLFFIFIPGYAVARLTRPQADLIEHFAFATPCAYGLVAICGLLTNVVHFSFTLITYSSFALPCVITALYRRHHTPYTPDTREKSYWPHVAYGVALLYLAMIVFVFAQNTMPTGWDVPTHALMINKLIQARVFPHSQSFYPPVFHAVNALIIYAAHIPTYRAVFLTVAATIPFFPLALYSYVRMATSSERLAGIATIASLAFAPLFYILDQALYPLIAALLIVPMLVIALYDSLVVGHLPSCIFAALLGIGLFYTHPTEFATVGLLGLATIVPPLLRMHSARTIGQRLGYGVAIVIIWVVAALPALKAVHSTIAGPAQNEVTNRHLYARTLHVDVGGAIHSYLYWLVTRNESFLLLSTLILGTVLCLVRRRFVGLAIIQLLVFVMAIDASTFSLAQRLYTFSFPWMLWERLSATQYWLTLPLAAIGIEAMIRFTYQHIPRYRRDRVFAFLISLPFIILGIILPFRVTVGLAIGYAHARTVAGPADSHAILWLTQHYSATSSVINDEDSSHLPNLDVPTDAAIWLPTLAGPQPLFGTGGTGPGTFVDRIYLLHHIADNPLPSRAREFIMRYNVGYVFYGRQLRPEAPRHLHASALFTSPNLHLVYPNPKASYVHCLGEKRSACSLAPPYIFAIDRNRISVLRAR